jgi:hypothetical protein
MSDEFKYLPQSKALEQISDAIRLGFKESSVKCVINYYRECDEYNQKELDDLLEEKGILIEGGQRNPHSRLFPAKDGTRNQHVGETRKLKSPKNKKRI